MKPAETTAEKRMKLRYPGAGEVDLAAVRERIAVAFPPR